MSEFYELDDTDMSKDVVDTINDLLSATCEGSSSISDSVADYIEKADEILRMKGFSLDFSDIDQVRSDDTIRSVSDGEVENILLPIYKGDEQSEYNLSVNYSYETDQDMLMIDMEMQYVWEEDMDDEDDYGLNDLDVL